MFLRIWTAFVTFVTFVVAVEQRRRLHDQLVAAIRQRATQ
jgi:hypothetical protein